MTVTESSVGDPGSGAFLTPASEMENPDLGHGINIRDHITESLVTVFGLKSIQILCARSGIQ